MLGASETGLPGPGGPRRGGGTPRTLGARGDRAAVRALAPLPRRRVRASRPAAALDSTPGATGAATAAWAGDSGPESRRVVPRANKVVAGAVDLCPGGRRGADQQCGGADVTTHRAVAQGDFRLR